MAYTIGQLVTLEGRFTVDDALTNPGAVTCIVEAPDGTETTPTATSSESGVWTATVTATAAGRWRYRFEGTTPVQATDEGSFLVSPSFAD